MAGSVLANIRQFLPFQPVFDPRRLDNSAVIDGQNFLYDVDGPRAAFASKLANANIVIETNRAIWKEMLVEDELFYGTPTGIWRINPVSGYFEQLLSVAVNSQFLYWPWSYAKIGNLYYFAQHDVGLWQYNPITQEWAEVDTSGNAVNWVCGAYGHLVCLSDDIVFFSALDDGTDFTPSISTGAGFQTLSILSKNAFRVDGVSDGIVISTDQGWIKGEFVQASFIFRWYVISRAIKSFTPNAVANVADIGLIGLDKFGGFFITSDGRPQPWEPTFGEYLKNSFFKGMDHKKFGVLQMYYSEAAKMLFVSFASNARQGTFQTTFVYYLPSQKWGVFSRSHLGIFELFDPSINTTYTAYMGTDGYIHRFDGNIDCEHLPDDPNVLADFAFHIPDDPRLNIMLDLDTGLITVEVNIIFEFTDDNPVNWANVQTTGLYVLEETLLSDTEEGEGDPDTVIGVEYEFNSNMFFDPSGATLVKAHRYLLPVYPLDARLDVGPMRFAEQLTAMETSAIDQVVVGITKNTGPVINEDWNIDGGEEDWGNWPEDVVEDWGAGALPADNYNLFLIPTDDGVNAQYQGEEKLEVLENLGAALTYSPLGFSAIYHKLSFRAEEEGQTFAVKTVDLTGRLTGVHQ